MLRSAPLMTWTVFFVCLFVFHHPHHTIIIETFLLYFQNTLGTGIFTLLGSEVFSLKHQKESILEFMTIWSLLQTFHFDIETRIDTVGIQKCDPIKTQIGSM